jgi:hypothetical protein
MFTLIVHELCRRANIVLWLYVKSLKVNKVRERSAIFESRQILANGSFDLKMLESSTKRLLDAPTCKIEFLVKWEPKTVQQERRVSMNTAN